MIGPGRMPFAMLTTNLAGRSCAAPPGRIATRSPPSSSGPRSGKTHRAFGYTIDDTLTVLSPSNHADPEGLSQDGLAPSFARGFRFWRGIDAEFLTDVGEFLRIGEAAVRHHRAQFDEPRLGKEQPRKLLAGVEPH
jgi:hypothetical protein